MKTFTVPVDIKVSSEDSFQAEMDVSNFMKIAYRDYKHIFNIEDYEFPVDFPLEPDD